MHKIIKRLLEKRGIPKENFEELLSENPKLTYDPFLMKNLKEGAERIIESLNKKEKICIYGDYDADGVTSTALMMDYLSNFEANVMYYIPSRFSEGYGLNKDALLELKNAGVNLVVTVDCGSVSFEEVEYGKAIGLDFVITDHHDISSVMSDTLVVSPKHPESTYPFMGLAGVGVAFKMVQALRKMQNAPKEYIAALLDLVAIGTIGDIMPMMDENRTLVKYGIKRINQNPRLGIRKLIEVTFQENEEVKSMELSYKVVPCINAAGRIGSADLAVRLLLSKNEEEAAQLAEELVANNLERRRIQDESWVRCEAKIEEENLEKDVILVICDDVHEGIAGIVAGKIKEHHYKPAIILTTCDNDYYKGTSRSLSGLHLYDLLNEFSDLYERFGGHAGACGFLMKKSNYEEFETRLLKRVEEIKKSKPEIFERSNVADLEVNIGDIDEQLVKELDGLEPFGRDFEKPMFMINAEKLEDARRMGTSLNHIRFSAVNKKGKRISCVKFNAIEEEMESIEKGKKSSVYGYTEINEWRNNRSLQIRVLKMSLN